MSDFYRPGSDDSFQLLATRVKTALAKYGKMNDQQLLALQRLQLETLRDLEVEFRQTLIAHRWGPSVYRLFVHKICEENRGILTARPYFRERQTVCNGPINSALEARAAEKLYRFGINYQFVVFALRARKWSPGSKIRQLADKIAAARENIVELNMPLAISQARIFWGKAPSKAAYTHLTYMDLVQIGFDGLLSAVDKFVLPSKRKYRSEKLLNEQFRRFRPMQVQRIVGNLIENYSETSIHFYPKDKRKLYRAHKLTVRQQGGVDYERVAAAVNTNADGSQVDTKDKTDAAEIGQLLFAASALTQGNSMIGGEEGEYDDPMDRHAAEASWRPDTRYEKSEALQQLGSAMAKLPILDRKLLRLKGITV